MLNGPRPWRRSDGVGSCDCAGVQEDFVHEIRADVVLFLVNAHGFVVRILMLFA